MRGGADRAGDKIKKERKEKEDKGKAHLYDESDCDGKCWIPAGGSKFPLLLPIAYHQPSPLHQKKDTAYLPFADVEVDARNAEAEYAAEESPARARRRRQRAEPRQVADRLEVRAVRTPHLREERRVFVAVVRLRWSCCVSRGRVRVHQGSGMMPMGRMRPAAAAAATRTSSSGPHPGSCTPFSQIASALRSGAVSPSSRYRTALSSRLVLLAPPLPRARPIKSCT